MAKLKKFRVWARTTSYCYLDVKAKDEEQALELARETDGGYYTPATDEYGGFEIMEEDVESGKDIRE